MFFKVSAKYPATFARARLVSDGPHKSISLAKPSQTWNASITKHARSVADFDVLKILSHGRGGTIVYLAQDKLSSANVAIKVIPKLTGVADDDTERQDQYEEVLRERDIHEALSSPATASVVPLLCSWHDTENFYIVTELMAGGNMAIEMLRSQRLDEDRARLYAAELIVCVEELRKKGVVHRDIKPANIMFTPDGHLRLLDFGLSARYTPRPDDEDLDSSSCALAFEVDETVDSGSFLFPVQDSVWTSSLRCGTCHFMTPEQHQGLPYGIEVDEWAIGVILHCMLTARMPFGAEFFDEDQVGDCIIHQPLVFKESDRLSDSAKALIQGMLQKDPRNRPSLGDVKAHPFFATIDWECVKTRQTPAPWKPYLPPLPRLVASGPSIQEGRRYDDLDDPCPGFDYTFPQMDLGNATLSMPPHVVKRWRWFRSIAKRKGCDVLRDTKAVQSPTPHSPASPSASSASLPYTPRKPIVILATPSKTDNSCTTPDSTTSVTPSTPLHAPPGLKQLEDSPSPLVEPTSYQTCDVPLSTSSIHELPSTPDDFTSLSTSDQVTSTHDDHCYEAIIPEELHLQEWEIPKEIHYRPALKPHAISETDCVQLLTKRRSYLKPLLLPELVSKRTSMASSSSPCDGHIHASDHLPFVQLSGQHITPSAACADPADEGINLSPSTDFGYFFGTTTASSSSSWSSSSSSNDDCASSSPEAPSFVRLRGRHVDPFVAFAEQEAEDVELASKGIPVRAGRVQRFASWIRRALGRTSGHAGYE